MRQKRPARLNWTAVGIMTVLVVFLVYVSGSDFLSLFQPMVKYDELTEEQIRPNIRVEGDIYAVLDSFANEQTWTENRNGSTTPKKTSKYYYVIPGPDGAYMALEAAASNSSKYNSLMSDTMDFLAGTKETLGENVVPFVGKIEKLDGELNGYFQEWFEGLSIPEDQKISYMLVPRSFPSVWAILAFTILVLIADVLYVVLTLRKIKKQRAMAAEAAAMGSYDQQQPVAPMGEAPAAPAAQAPVDSQPVTVGTPDTSNKANKSQGPDIS